MKIRIEISLVAFLLAYPFIVVKGYGITTINDSTIYSQKVVRDDRMFEDMFRFKRGILLLTDKKLEFKSKMPSHSCFDFSITYDQIKFIRIFYGFVVPNRIRIKAISGESYRLFTYRKRKIIKITRYQMTNSDTIGQSDH